MSNEKSKKTYVTIGEAAKKLNLIDKKTGRLQTHTIRYWETQFKQIKPAVKAGNRRYYSKENLEMIKIIKFLLKDKGLTIIGAKKILDDLNGRSLDEKVDIGINKPDLTKKKIIKEKLIKISKIISELKKIK